MLINDNHGDYGEKMQRCKEYMEALEQERRKIKVFQRELPLCLELVSQAIEAFKQQLSGTTGDYFHGQSQCSEQTSTEEPVLEEFIPIKRSSSSDDDDDDEQQSKKPKIISSTSNKDVKNSDKPSTKSDWLRSAQLWNQSPDPPIKGDSPRKVTIKEVKRNGSGGAFHPFKKEKSVGTGAPGSMETSPLSAVPATAASSTVGVNGGSGGGAAAAADSGSKKEDEEDKEGQSQRKARRCWSPDLHKRFLQALQQLGGAHVATPKQIRELMKVDGLTNDEVKSHLQKYRLHTRRPGPPIHNNNPQAPQFVVVGGIWVPPPDYAAMAKTAASEDTSGVATSNGIYAPITTVQPSLPQERQQHKQMHSDHERGSHTDGGVHCNSPATSSSTHTTTASHAF